MSSISIRHNKPFGPSIDFEHGDTDVVVICMTDDRGFGMRPTYLCLPHQVYVDDLENMMTAYGAKEAFLVPARSCDYVAVDRSMLAAKLAEHAANEELACMPWGERIGARA